MSISQASVADVLMAFVRSIIFRIFSSFEYLLQTVTSSQGERGEKSQQNGLPHLSTSIFL